MPAPPLPRFEQLLCACWCTVTPCDQTHCMHGNVLPQGLPCRSSYCRLHPQQVAPTWGVQAGMLHTRKEYMSTSVRHTHTEKETIDLKLSRLLPLGVSKQTCCCTQEKNIHEYISQTHTCRERNYDLKLSRLLPLGVNKRTCCRDRQTHSKRRKASHKT